MENAFIKLDLSKYKNKFVVEKKNEYLSTTKEIWEHFGKQISFPLVMKMCKTKGINNVRSIFLEVQKSGGSVKTFMYKYGELPKLPKQI